MTKSELQAKYPFMTVRSEPSATCTICKGAGEYNNKGGNMHVCLCACMSDEYGDEIRNIAADVMHRRMWK